MSDMKHHNVLLLTGIGCPGQMRMDLNRRFASITPLNYADHHYYTDGDMDTISAELEALPQPRMIITTEKDVTRLMSMQSLPDRIAAHIWVLPIGIRFMQGKERIFNDKITGYVQKNIRNRGMAQSQNDDKA